MIRASVVAAASAFLTSAVPLSERTAFTLPSDMKGQTILYIGAHPDDEWGMAPILADACVDRGARCHFVVASEAKSGGCLFTIGMRDFDKCTRIRRAEMVNAATLFGGKVEFLGLHDLFYSFNEAGKARTIDEWSTASGGRGALVSRFEKIIRKQRPQMLFTFDPRHGSSCHASHMSTAQLRDRSCPTHTKIRKTGSLA